MKLILLCVAAWLAGILSYLGALAVFYHQFISTGDLIAVVFWSLIAFGICSAALYSPALKGLRWLLRGARPVWAFPVLAVFLGAGPTALILFIWGGGLRSLFTPEASLFYAMFLAVGLVLGFGFPRLYSDDRNA